NPLLIQCLHHQKAVELLLGKVQRVQHGVLSQVLMQPCLLHGAQLPVMAAHEAEQPPVPASLGVVLLPQLQEVLVDQTHDVKAIRHDQGVGKVRTRNAPIGLGQKGGHSESFNLSCDATKPSSS